MGSVRNVLDRALAGSPVPDDELLSRQSRKRRRDLSGASVAGRLVLECQSKSDSGVVVALTAWT